MAGKVRDSGIELLKIFGIFLIVINHIVQTTASMIDITHATTDIRIIILVILRHFGAWGNAIFLYAQLGFG